MNKRLLFQKTRSSAFLIKTGLLLAGLLLALGNGISLLNTARTDFYQELISMPAPEDEFGSWLLEDKVDSSVVSAALAEKLQSAADFHLRLADVAELLHFVEPDGPVELPILETLHTDEQAISAALIIACVQNDFQPLEKIAGETPPPEANYALALAHKNAGQTKREISALNREIGLHDAAHARKRLVRVYLALDKFDALEVLAQDSDYQEFFTPRILQEIAVNQLNWPLILRTVFPAAYDGVRSSMLVLALLSGLVWAIVLMQFGGGFSSGWKWILPALALGILSAHATLLSVFWQENQMGFGFGNETPRQLLYCLAIGLREEGLKLLFFCPLIPFLLKRDDLTALTVGGLVGLGFALEENINYFSATAGLSAVARFATANFLHIALTALCGFSLVRAVGRRGENVSHAASTFILAVAIHGLYDAFLMVPALVEYSWLTYTVFVLMAYHYFGWLRHLREEWNDAFSITATFTYGIILLTGFSFIFVAWMYGPMPALQAILGEVIGIAIILFLFYREIPETVD